MRSVVVFHIVVALRVAHTLAGLDLAFHAKAARIISNIERGRRYRSHYTVRYANHAYVAPKGYAFYSGVSRMQELRGQVFRIDTISVQKEGVDPPEYQVFRVPVQLKSESQLTQEDNAEDTTVQNDVQSTVMQNAVAVRMPFKAFIQRHIPELEAKMDVRLSLTVRDRSLLLMANGDRATEAIEEMLNRCRRSRVYNFYLCFPVRGAAFQQDFDELKQRVTNFIGSGVAYEKRPHVTLALLNLVTDSDVNTVVKALQGSALAVSSLSEEADVAKRAYSIELSGVKSIKYKGKSARRSVFMAHAYPEDTLMDIASEFQDSVKRAVNAILIESHKAISKSKEKVSNERKTIGMMTEEEAAAHGVYLTRGGNVEVTYTDVAVMDPDGEVDDDQLNQMLAEIYEKYKDYHDAPKAKPRKTKGKQREYSDKGDQQKPQQYQEVSTQTELHSAVAETQNEEEDGDDDFLEHETSVTSEFHVTLLRNQRVEQLKDVPFHCQGKVSCVELRPRGKETCVFKAHTNGRLIRFLGQRYDGNASEEAGITQVIGSNKADMPSDLLVDPGTSQADNATGRFVFWI